ncbi:MAG: 2-dehydropantoate 2-reductase [Pseudomonadota bacterium]
MRVLIFGAGAIGGYLGAKLAMSGVDVTFFARGPHLEAMQTNGLILHTEGERHVVQGTFTGDPDSVGDQDYVIIGIKSTSMDDAAPQIARTLGPDTAIVTAMNGVPYWYFYKHGGEFDGLRLKSVDPDGAIWNALDPSRAIGCVVYPAGSIKEPGVIEHTYSNRFTLGEPDGSRSDRVTSLSKAMTAAGLKAPVRPRIRNEIWVKLWGNLAFNPASVLTRGTLEDIASDPGTRAIVRAMMVEAQDLASKTGISFPIDVDKRIEGALEVGAHKTSMLQDLEAGKSLEIDAMLGAVCEMGRLVGVPTPTCDMILALVHQLQHKTLQA